MYYYFFPLVDKNRMEITKTVPVRFVVSQENETMKSKEKKRMGWMDGWMIHNVLISIL